MTKKSQEAGIMSGDCPSTPFALFRRLLIDTRNVCCCIQTTIKRNRKRWFIIYIFFSDNLGGSLLIPTRGFRSHGGTTSSHPFLIGSFHYKPSMFILGHPQPFSNTPKRKRNVQPQMRSSKGDQTWVSGRSSYRWIPCEKNW